MTTKTTNQKLTDEQAAQIFETGEGFTDADTSPTDAIAAAVADRKHAQDAIDDAVDAARGAGVTWVEIARALGVSHQAAIKRYSEGVIRKR